nr:unnamed protein product [Haemonchus contortus]
MSANETTLGHPEQTKGSSQLDEKGILPRLPAATTPLHESKGSTQGTNENAISPMSPSETTLGYPMESKGSTQGKDEYKGDKIEISIDLGKIFRSLFG